MAREPARLSAVKVGALMLAKGFPADEGVIATGIGVCTAESGRRRKAVNVNSDGGSKDRGPWQINDRWHPEVSDDCAYSWGCATQAAATISSGGSDWSPWTTYHADIGRSYRGAARRAIRETNGGTQFVGFFGDLWDKVWSPPWENPSGAANDPSQFKGQGPGIPGLSNPLGAVGDAVQGIVQFFIGLGELILTPEGWLRLGKMLFGVIALLTGMSILIRETSGVNVGRAAAKAVPVA